MTAIGKIPRLVFLVQGLEPHLVQLEPTADGADGVEITEAKSHKIDYI